MSGPLEMDNQSLEALVGEVADEFTERIQRGEHPKIEEFLDHHPEIADTLRPVLRALQAIGPADTDGSSADVLWSSSLAEGRRLGDFRVRHEIGRGGMGIVYEAEQISLARRVALKMLPFAAVLDDRQLRRFKNEAQAAALLRHPNIVSVHAVGCERGVHYYAMELIEGQSLAQIVESLRLGDRLGPHADQRSPRDGVSPSTDPPETDNPSPGVAGTRPVEGDETTPLAVLSTQYASQRHEFFRSVARLGVQAADAIDYAHHEGIIHRDIKPSNLLLDKSGKLWITDFGLAQVQGKHNLTMTGDLLGTLRYMSPEQAAGRKLLDHRTDIYSLGVTLYELLTLQPAFPSDNRQHLLRQIAEDPPATPRQVNDAVPKDLETIVLKAVDKEPDVRYGAAREIADDLRRFLEDKPIQARRPGLLERGAKWLRRHRAVATLAAMFLVMAVVVLSVSIVLTTRAYNREATERARANQVVDSLLDRIAQIIERETNQRDLYQVLDLSEYALELDKKLHAEIRDSYRHRLRMARMQYQRGVCAANWGEYETALPALRAAIEIYENQTTERRVQRSQDLANCYYYLGHSLQGLQQRELAARAYRACVELFRRSGHQAINVEQLPSRVEDLAEECRRIVHGIDEQSTQRTVEQLSAAIKHDSHNAGNYQQRAAVFKEQGEFDKAIADLEEAIRLNPNGVDAYVELAYVYVEKGDMAGLMANWDRAVSNNPQAGRIHQWRGWFHYLLGNLDDAIRDVTTAVEINPKEEALGYMVRGCCYTYQGDFPSAVDDFGEVIRLNPKDAPWNHAWRGYAYWHMGRPQEALADYNQAIRLAPQLTLTYCWRALVHASRGRLDDALADVRQTARMRYRLANRQEGAVWGRHEVAWFLATCPDPRLRDPDRAIELATESLELQPNYGQSLTALGAAQYRAGKLTDALATLQEAAKRPSYRDPAAWLFLAMTHWQLDRQQDAHYWYDKAAEWIQQHQPRFEEPHRFRREAAELLGLAESRPTAQKKRDDEPSTSLQPKIGELAD